MVCVELWPLPKCGLLGNCENNTCICSTSSFSQSSEWAFYLDNISKRETLNCSSHTSFIRYAYLICGTCALVSLLFHFYILRSYAQFRRRVLIYSTLTSLVGFSFARFADENRLFGEDPLFTSLFALCFLLMSWTGIASADKFIEFQIKKIPIAMGKHANRIEKLLEFRKYLMAYELFIEFPIIVGFPFIERYLVLILIKILFTCRTLIMILWLSLDWILVSLIIADIKIVCSLSSEHGENLGLILKLEGKVIELESRRKVGIIYNIPTALMFALPVVWDFFLSLWIYYVPINFAHFSIMALLFVLPEVRKLINQYFSHTSFSDATAINTNLSSGDKASKSMNDPKVPISNPVPTG